MTLSPAELRHQKPGRGLLGYRRTDVDGIMVEASAAFEEVWRERADLQDRVEELETALAQHRESEDALRRALVSAEQAADERRAQAGREAELIVREAEARARALVQESYAEREQLRRELERLRTVEGEFRARLRSLLGVTLQAVRDHEEWLAGQDGEDTGA